MYFPLLFQTESENLVARNAPADCQLSLAPILQSSYVSSWNQSRLKTQTPAPFTTTPVAHKIDLKTSMDSEVTLTFPDQRMDLLYRSHVHVSHLTATFVSKLTTWDEMSISYPQICDVICSTAADLCVRQLPSYSFRRCKPTRR